MTEIRGWKITYKSVRSEKYKTFEYPDEYEPDGWLSIKRHAKGVYETGIGTEIHLARFVRIVGM